MNLLGPVLGHRPVDRTRVLDLACAALAVAGVALSIVGIVYGVQAVRAAGEYADGLEGLSTMIGIAALPFFVPAAVCTLAGLRIDSDGLRSAGRVLVLAGYLGGPVLLFLAFATLFWG